MTSRGVSPLNRVHGALGHATAVWLYDTAACEAWDICLGPKRFAQLQLYHQPARSVLVISKTFVLTLADDDQDAQQQYRVWLRRHQGHPTALPSAF